MVKGGVPREEAEVFGIWKDWKDIKNSIDWVRNLI